MKIAVVGCGALGSYYGAMLCRAGCRVHFLLRSDFDVVRKSGVWIESDAGNFHVQPECARAPEEIGPADLVLIGLKTTANHLLPRLLPPLIGPESAVLTLQNGLGNEAAVAAVVGAEKTLGGLCFVCLNRVAPGRIRHIAHGAIVMGEYAGAPQPRTHRICETIAAAGVHCKVAAHLEQAHWEKLVWNIPFNGLGVAGAAGYDAVVRGRMEPGAKLQFCLTTDLLLGDPRWEQLARELMMETIAAARAKGLGVPESAAEHQISRTRQMGSYKASTLIDFERGQPLELESLFLEPCREARQIGVPCPRLEALCAVLMQLSLRERPE
ncbi:MAG TPA: 2-dehydropantoate 2-reductase [Candidatus Baltobacteraceae bacterium]|jgi:2-dehydropantoate 2-reductase|nr:2-dehydropantoate 2-reductase [Candidatus Baltobacteraceae bacterium]